MAKDARTHQAGTDPAPGGEEGPGRRDDGALGARGLGALERAATFLLVDQAQATYRRCADSPDAAAALQLFCDAEALRQRALEHATGAGDALLQQVHGVLEGERETALQSLRDPLEPRAAVRGVRSAVDVPTRRPGDGRGTSPGTP